MEIQEKVKKLTDELAEMGCDYILMVHHEDKTYVNNLFDYRMGLRFLSCFVEQFMNLTVPHISYRQVIHDIRNIVDQTIVHNKAVPNNKVEQAAKKLEDTLARKPENKKK